MLGVQLVQAFGIAKPVEHTGALRPVDQLGIASARHSAMVSPAREMLSHSALVPQR